MGKMIELERPDGQLAPAYLVEPPGGPGAHARGVVLIQEWWGLNDQIKGTAEELGAAGYRVILPDLYRGKVTAKSDEASHLMTGLDWGAAANQDVRAAALRLHALGSKRVAVLGFCMGGALTIIAAVRIPEVSAAVCFYGIPPEAAADPKEIRVPLLAHFARDDDWCTPKAVDALEWRLKEGNVEYELHRYDAKHAFCNSARPEVYDAVAAKSAWARTYDFLEKRL